MKLKKTFKSTKRQSIFMSIFRKISYVFLKKNLLPDGSQPTKAPFFLFVSINQFSSGLKYSNNAPASILSSPVSTFIASGQGFDEPSDSIFLERNKKNHFILEIQ
jgi:hypothetical protein